MFLNRSIKYLIVILIVQYCDFAFSQSNDSIKFKTEEINIFGNKIITNKFDAPIKIQSISREQINNKNGETLSDILQLGGNIFIKSYGGNSLNTLSMNGLGSEQTLVLLNGFKMNSYQNSQIDLNSIGKDNIERIEILNNGSSSIYGSQAIGGVINIVTNNNFVNDLSLKLNAQAGSYEQKKIYLGINKRLTNLNIDLNYSKESSLNNYDYYFNNGINRLLKQRENSNYNFSNYSVNINYYNNRNLLLSGYSNYSDQLRYIPGIETGSAPSNSYQQDRNFNNILSIENILSKSSSFKSQFNFQNNLSDYSDRVITNSYYKNIVLSNTSQINFTETDYEIITGYEISYATLNSNEVEDNVKRTQPGVFIVSKINITESIKLFPSVRYDYVSDINKNVLTGKFGMNIKPFNKYNLNFKASAGNNFASPTFNELYWKDLGNKNLKPESSVNYDAGIIIGFNSFSENTIEFTYTHINVTDKIVWSPESGSLWTPKNIGKSTSNVILIDANATKEFYDDFSLNLNVNYSYTQSLNKSSGYEGDPTYDKQIFYIPEQMAKFNTSLKYKETGLNFFYTYTGKRYTNFENTNILPAVNLIEGNIYQNFIINKISAQIKLEINNVLNQNYQIIAGYPMPLRNYKLALSLEY